MMCMAEFALTPWKEKGENMHMSCKTFLVNAENWNMSITLRMYKAAPDFVSMHLKVSTLDFLQVFFFWGGWTKNISKPNKKQKSLHSWAQNDSGITHCGG